jgi:hypothetical protein
VEVEGIEVEEAGEVVDGRIRRMVILLLYLGSLLLRLQVRMRRRWLLIVGDVGLLVFLREVG